MAMTCPPATTTADVGAQAWPPERPGLPGDRLFNALAAAAAPDAEQVAAAGARLEHARGAVAAALRFHCLDVDVRACGSFASGTAVKATDAVDLAVRTWSPPATWRSSSRRAPADVKRWLEDACGTAIRETPAGLRIDFGDGAPDVQVLLAEDAAAHADRVRARDAALGAGRFAATIRVIKHLIKRGERTAGGPLVPSYALERLALRQFRTRYIPAEGLVDFLALLPDAPEVEDRAEMGELCSDAGRLIAAVITADADVAEVTRELAGPEHRAVEKG